MTESQKKSDGHQHFSRREITMYLLGMLSGALILIFSFGVYLNWGSIKTAIVQETSAQFAAHSCSEAAPPVTNGAQVWVTNPRPAPAGMVRFCARLILNGVRVDSAEFRPIMRYETIYGDIRELGLGTTVGVSGLLETSLLNITDARLDQPVEIEVQISPDASWQEIYTAHTTLVFSENYLTYPTP